MAFACGGGYKLEWWWLLKNLLLLSVKLNERNGWSNLETECGCDIVSMPTSSVPDNEVVTRLPLLSISKTGVAGIATL